MNEKSLKGKSWLTNTLKGEKLGEITPQKLVSCDNSVFIRFSKTPTHTFARWMEFIYYHSQ